METKLRHDPALIEAHAANQRAVALANVPDYVIADYEAMTPAQRRYQHGIAEFQADRHDILASRPGHPSNDYNRQCAANYRRTAAALKAIGL